MRKAALLLTMATMAFASMAAAEAEADKEPGARRVVLDGTLAKIPHQHPIKVPEGKKPMYVDTASGGQEVVYFDAEGEVPKAGWQFRVHARELRFTTQSKRPGSEKTFPVVQYEALRWERLVDGQSTEEVAGMVQGLFIPSHPFGAVEALEAKILSRGRVALPALTRCADLPDKTGKAGTCRALLKKLLGGLPKTGSYVAWWEANDQRSLQALRTLSKK